MKNRWLLNLALLLVVAVLAAVAWWKPGQDDAPAPLTQLDPATVTHAIIERPDEKIELRRENGAWHVTSPFAARANRHNADALARLSQAPVASRLDQPANPKEYGLDPPRVRVVLNGESIGLGAIHPLANQVYALYRGEVALIAAHHEAVALYPFERFLDTRLIEEGREPVSLRMPGFRLVRRDGVWQREPAMKDLSTDRIHDFVQEWRNASALEVERARGGKTLTRIEIVFERAGKPAPVMFAVMAREPEFVLRREDEGLQYRFPEETGKRLLNLSEK